jgi:hypothetical protein
VLVTPLASGDDLRGIIAFFQASAVLGLNIADLLFPRLTDAFT